MRYEPLKPLPPFDCTCGLKYPNFKMLDRHMRMERDQARRQQQPTTHFKVRGVTASEVAAKAYETKRLRRQKFLDGDGS